MGKVLTEKKCMFGYMEDIGLLLNIATFSHYISKQNTSDFFKILGKLGVDNQALIHCVNCFEFFRTII